MDLAADLAAALPADFVSNFHASENLQKQPWAKTKGTQIDLKSPPEHDGGVSLAIWAL